MDGHRNYQVCDLKVPGPLSVVASLMLVELHQAVQVPKDSGRFAQPRAATDHQSIGEDRQPRHIRQQFSSLRQDLHRA